MLDQGQCVGEFSRYLHNKGQQYVKQRDDKKTTEDLIQLFKVNLDKILKSDADLKFEKEKQEHKAECYDQEC